MEATTMSELDVTNTTWDVFDNTTLDLLDATAAPPRMSVRKMLERFSEAHAAIGLNNYYLIFILIVGFPGNILSLITIIRMPPMTSSTVYVSALAVVDNASIIIKALFLYLSLQRVDLGVAGCKIMYFLGNFTVHYANWILVGLTVERFCAIWFPLKVGAYCSTKNAGILLGIIATVLFGVNMPHLVMGSRFYMGSRKIPRCTYESAYKDFVEKIWYVVDAFVYAILPCIFIFVFNILVIIGIKRSGKIQKDLTNNKMDQMAEKFKQQRQITVMLIFVCIAFLILVVPNCLYFIIKPYLDYQQGSHQHAVNMFVEQFIYLLSDLSHAINFYLYFLSAKKFRRRAIDTLCCRKPARRAFASMSRTAVTNISTTSIYTTSQPNGSANGKTQ